VSNPSAVLDPVDAPRANPWLSLVATLIAVFMQLLDVSIVNVALPSIAQDLGATFASLQLVITAYTLAFACTLITAARLGDLYGRRRVFLLALGSFTLASVLCGVAQTPLQLEGARILQGFTAGMMAAQTLAIIATTFPRRSAAGCSASTAPPSGWPPSWDPPWVVR